MPEEADDLSAGESGVPGSVAGRRVTTGSYGLVLALILLSFVFGIAAADKSWGAFPYFLLQAGTLVLGLKASGAGRRAWRWATLLLMLMVVGVIISAFFSGARLDRGITALASAALVLITLIAIGRQLLRNPEVTGHTVQGALCVYLLVGLFFAFLNQFIGAFDSGPFFANHGDGTASDYLYFSYVTLTTVGFGDLVAISDLGRAFTVVEAIIGQLYLVTVVGFLVANFAGRERRR